MIPLPRPLSPEYRGEGRDRAIQHTIGDERGHSFSSVHVQVGLSMLLRDRVALVTGAGRGIGRAAALALAQAGARVAVNDIDPQSAAETAAAVRQTGERSLAVPGDVSVHETVEGLVDAAVQEFGHLDIAVANAYYSAREPFYDADLATFRRTIDVTMWGAFYTLRAATRQMLRQGQGGSIVVIGSPHAVLAVPLAMAYNMAKA